MHGFAMQSFFMGLALTASKLPLILPITEFKIQLRLVLSDSVKYSFILVELYLLLPFYGR
jgi:hypothetical protein